MDNSTIAAIATPMGGGGIGIIKISGPDALSIAESIFFKIDAKSDKPVYLSDSVVVSSLKSHQLSYGNIVDSSNGRILDEVLLAVMKAPFSYTREDVVEIHAHGGAFVLKGILNLVIEKGARLAEPGEFTKRAFINGRIDLTQAEAVIDIINARTLTSMDIAASQIKGGLKSQIEDMIEKLLHILAEIEAAIDFPDEVGDAVNNELALDNIQRHVILRLKALIEQYENAHFLRDGLKVVIAGPPNVGKSTLMNLLINKDRSIVTSIPGTTRDSIEDTFNLRGFPIVITDTAGFHDTSDPVEIIGIKKAREHVENSDLVLFMVDAASKIKHEEWIVFDKIKHKRLIIVLNKTDLLDSAPRLDLPKEWENIPKVNISARYNRGIEDLKEMITDSYVKDMPENRSSIVPNLRHKKALEQSLKAAFSAMEGLRSGRHYELISIDIQSIIDFLGEITGITTKPDVLDNIFNNFCIGK